MPGGLGSLAFVCALARLAEWARPPSVAQWASAGQGRSQSARETRIKPAGGPGPTRRVGRRGPRPPAAGGPAGRGPSRKPELAGRLGTLGALARGVMRRGAGPQPAASSRSSAPQSASAAAARSVRAPLTQRLSGSPLSGPGGSRTLSERRHEAQMARRGSSRSKPTLESFRQLMGTFRKVRTRVHAMHELRRTHRRTMVAARSDRN